MNRILVPVDFSDTSLNALSYAIKLFKDTALEVTILHTYKLMRSSAYSMKMNKLDEIMRDDAQQEMDSLLNKLQAEEPNISIKSKISKSDAVSAITTMGNSGTYDFIIMGTKGASGLKEVFIGSVAGGVISKTVAPVIVVPDAYVYQPLEEITFAIGGAVPFDAKVIEPLRKLATMNSSKVNILHIDDGEELDEEKDLSLIKDLKPSLINTSGEGNINDQLSEYLEKEEPRLLCLVRGTRDFFGRIFSESVTLKQTFSSPVPLLILHNE
jgi:nucleotide-binding universal stress UspA family protein